MTMRSNHGQWKPLTIEEMQAIAVARGGRCLSTEYVHSQTSLEWECGRGHRWFAAPNSVKRGTWCRACVREQSRLTLADMEAVAREKGGRCLSPQYVSARTPLEWECGLGHRWLATPDKVKQGAWCGVCAGKLRRKIHASAALADMQRIARERGGLCLSEQYVNSATPLEWECAQRHRWFASPGNVNRGTWCRICALERTKLTLADVQQVAVERGGHCLSEKYVDSITPLLFECAEGHRWEARSGAIRFGQWCPQCRYAQRRGTTDRMRSYAESRGGECLSDTYSHARQRLRWRCANGHEWEATASIVTRGQWCLDCQRDQSRIGIERMREIAGQHGGRCLSETYINVSNRLQWQCAGGHTWEATTNSVLQGRWCPYCGGVRHSLTEMQALARSRGGECISDAYDAVHRKLQWRCAKGHVWWTKPMVVLRGHWCPDCARLEQTKKRSKRLKYDYEG